MGLSPTALAKAAVDPSREGFWIRQAQRTRWKIAIPACLAIPVVATLYGDSPWIPTLIGSAEMILLPLGMNALAWQRRLEYRTLSFARIGGMALTALLSLGGLFANWHAWEWHLASFSAGAIATNLALFFMARTSAGESGIPNESLFRDALPLGCSQAAQQAYFGAGNFFVRELYPAQRFWEFGLPFRAYSFALMVPQYLLSTAMPALAQRAASQPEEYRALRRRLLAVLLAIGVPVAALATFAGPTPLTAIFGPGKEAGAESLRWLALAGLFVIFGAVATSCLVARGRNGAMLGLSASTAAIAIPASWMLTKAHGPSGAAIGCAIAEGIVAALSWALLLRAERGKR